MKMIEWRTSGATVLRGRSCSYCKEFASKIAIVPVLPFGNGANATGEPVFSRFPSLFEAE